MSAPFTSPLGASPLSLRGPRSRGFSITETLLAATVLGLVLFALLDLLPGTALAARRAEHSLEAVTLAQSMLDTLRATPFAELEPFKGTGWRGGSDALAALCPTQPWPRPAAEDGVALVARCRIDPVAGSDSEVLLRLAVSVRWTERASARLATDLGAEFAAQEAPAYREHKQELIIHAAGP